MRIILPLSLLLMIGCKGNNGKKANDTCWWCITGTATQGSGDTDTEDGGDEFDSEWAGDIDTTSGAGFYTFFQDDPFAGQNCDLAYEIVNSVSAGDCGPCEFAWELTLGPVEVYEDAGGCTGKMGMEGTVLRAGHKGPEELFMDDGGGWSAVGYSEVEGTEWFFAPEG